MIDFGKKALYYTCNKEICLSFLYTCPTTTLPRPCPHTHTHTHTHTHIRHSGQLIDGPQNGPAPGPWDIAAQPNQLFQDHEKHFEVPHTASVKMCHNCAGGGMTQCWRCRGRGRVSGGVAVMGGTLYYRNRKIFQ